MDKTSNLPQTPTLQQTTVSGSCSNEQVKPDKYEVIMAGNIMVAQGWKCGKCELIRAYDRPTCNCH